MTQPVDVEGTSEYVLDTSALLAQLHGEPGANLVAAVVSNAVISSVNWAETIQKVIAQGSMETADVRRDLESVGFRILPFTPEDAELAAELWSTTRQAGLSLGDRACLSLAHRLGLPALTADRAWTALNLDIEVRLIR